MYSILQGILLGIILNFLVGLTFFAMIETSISRGFKPALAMRFGILISDLILLAIAYVIAAELLEEIINHNYFRYIGGSLLIGYGVFYVVKNAFLNGSSKVQAAGSNALSRCFFNGLFINTFNPAVFLFWIVVLAISFKRFQDIGNVYLFIATAMIIFIVGDIVKIYYAAKLRNFLTNRVLNRIYLITGGLLVLFGLRVILFAL